MNRTNSFVNALKWWSPNNGSGNNHGTNGKTTFGSTVAVQKLRESKWFGPAADEQRIFCAVVECGFIVEVRRLKANGQKMNYIIAKDDYNNNNDDEDDEENEEQENQKDEKWFGVVVCKTAKDKKPSPETIEIYSVKFRGNDLKVVKHTLADIWKQGWMIRINNFSDKEKQAHSEKDIKNQVSFARKTRVCLWHNSQHFAYWCRYGSRQQDIRRRQMSECVKWGTVGMNAGMLLVLNQRQKSHSMSK